MTMLSFIREAIDKKLEDAGYVTPQLGEMKPEIGDWQTLENGTYEFLMANSGNKEVLFSLTSNHI